MGNCFGLIRKTRSEAAPAPAPEPAPAKVKVKRKLSAEDRRKLQKEALEKRRIEAECCVMKDPQRYKTHKARVKELERRDRKAALQGLPVLKWQRD